VASPRRPCPYPDANALRAAIIAAGGVEPLSHEINAASNTVRKWAREMGLDLRAVLEDRQATRKAITAPRIQHDFAWLLDAIKTCADGATVSDIADAADTSPRRVREAIPRAREAGYRIPLTDDDTVTLERVSPAPTNQRHKVSLNLFAGDRIRFGVVSDTHLGSRECHLADLHAAYDLFVDEGITEVFHPGDLVAGIGVYRHQHRDLNPDAHTFDEQVKFATREYPQRPGIITRIISGNHDVEGEFGKLGADACLAVANQRDDLQHGGVYSAWYELQNGAQLHMLHPMGGASYATSYKLQKLAESYAAGKKPAMLLAGHWHRTGFFWARGIALMHAGTFEGSTNLAIRLGLGEAHVGCWIIEATLADDGTITRICPEWVPFWNGRRA